MTTTTMTITNIHVALHFALHPLSFQKPPFVPATYFCICFIFSGFHKLLFVSPRWRFLYQCSVVLFALPWGCSRFSSNSEGSIGHWPPSTFWQLRQGSYAAIMRATEKCTFSVNRACKLFNIHFYATLFFKLLPVTSSYVFMRQCVWVVNLLITKWRFQFVIGRIIPKWKRSYPGSQKTPWRMTGFWMNEWMNESAVI